jgi:hypothetical protein
VAWDTVFTGSPMFILQQKLKVLKGLLKTWNMDIFGHIHHRVSYASNKLFQVQTLIDQMGFSSSLADEELACLTEYNNAVNVENAFWKEKARNDRFLEGDLKF